MAMLRGAADDLPGARIKEVSFTVLRDPFSQRHDAHMPRLSGDWSLIEVCQVTLESGVVGVGETIVQYTWGRVPAEAAGRVTGRNVFECLWDDAVGCGLQMALWDAAGKQAGVPCHALFGRKVRDAAPISWWCLDFSAPEWVEEAKLAVQLGYTSLKLKGRPWRDVLAQVAVGRRRRAPERADRHRLQQLAGQRGHRRACSSASSSATPTWPSSRRPSPRAMWPGTSRSGPRRSSPSRCTSAHRRS